MSAEGAPAAHDDYYEGLTRLHTVPLWKLASSTAPEPMVLEQAHVWRWAEVYPELLRAADVVKVGTDEAERRVLTFRNPGLPPMAVGATQTLVTSLQMLLPGEVAPAHRHSYNALRFIIEGNGAFTVVDGEKVPMEPGDLLLTPGDTWHDHGHDGADGPVVWMDGLDAPFVFNLRSAFYEDYPGRLSQPVVEGPGVSEASPPKVYKWAESHQALQRLQAAGDDPFDGALLEYVNPFGGGHVLPTTACYLQGLRAGFHGRARRQTSSAVCLVVRGSGRAVIDGTAYPWGPNDIFCLPGWSWHELVADAGDDVVLFRMSDVPMLEPFGLHRQQAYEHDGGYQEAPDRALAGAAGR